MHTARIPIQGHEMLAARFNATRFSAQEWVNLTADAGQRCIVITSGEIRSHPGVSMTEGSIS